MTENEKIIETINHHLKKLSQKQLRLILTVLFQFADSTARKGAA